MVLLSDPQIVDPHTYPGRPWPLSSLTVSYTDRYLKRSYQRIQSVLDPDSIYFLGDLFDGGREWRTGAQGFKITDERWKRYTHKFWRKEYRRFANIFLRSKDTPGQEARHRNMILSLPGNHDIGFGSGVQSVVRNRFQTYFGESNRVDIIGNHTFVGLDTVSLSAVTGKLDTESIWRPATNFLDNVQTAIEHKTNVAFAFDAESPKYAQTMTEHIQGSSEADLGRSARARSVKSGIQQLPIVAMSHVPLYRGPGTPCGPLRERSPPSAPGLTTDEPNAIRVAGGYQYQNVLTQEVTKLITDKLGHVRYAFSGDDHDYCELTHTAYSSAAGGIKEVTVKSMSWAMGIRKPGFLLVSLWNPVDKTGKSLEGGPRESERPTLSSQLCLLPDQLSIFIRYIWCLVITTLVLGTHALVAALRDRDSKLVDTILPLSTPVTTKREHDSLSKSTNRDLMHGLTPPRARSNSNASQLSGYRLSPDSNSISRIPLWQAGHMLLKKAADGGQDLYLDDDDESKGFGRRSKTLTAPQACLVTLSWNIRVVAGVVGLYYLWLLQRG